MEYSGFGDVFPDALQSSLANLKKSSEADRVDVPAERQFTGFDNYKKVCDSGIDVVLLATPAGSTAYNLSAHGPILPIDSPLLALTPISPFRPRRWRGAILPNTAVVTFKTRESDKRPVSAVADNVEFKDVAEVVVREDRSHQVTLLFDPGTGLEERVLSEQFRY